MSILFIGFIDMSHYRYWLDFIGEENDKTGFISLINIETPNDYATIFL